MTIEQFLLEHNAHIQITGDADDRGRIVAVLIQNGEVVAAGDDETILGAIKQLLLDYGRRSVQI